MADVSIRDLRNHGGEVVERAQRGEQLTITGSGKPVERLVGLLVEVPHPDHRPAHTPGDLGHRRLWATFVLLRR